MKIAVVFATAQLTYAAPAMAGPDEVTAAMHRVNIAGRQRMLSQRMSKAACFVANGVDVEGQQTVLRNAFYLFAVSHDALINGEPILGLTAESDQGLLRDLAVVGRDWENFSGLFAATLQEDYNGEAARSATGVSSLRSIDEAGLVLLGHMDKSVGEMALAYSDRLPDMLRILSITIDVAGRQRMFTQRASKEFCLIDAGVSAEVNRTRLAETVSLFTLTLDALINGLPGMVVPAPNDLIDHKLNQVLSAWEGPKQALEQAASGAPITDAQRAVVVRDMERVLFLMNEAVGMYEGVIPEQN